MKVDLQFVWDSRKIYRERDVLDFRSFSAFEIITSLQPEIENVSCLHSVKEDWI